MQSERERREKKEDRKKGRQKTNPSIFMSRSARPKIQGTITTTCRGPKTRSRQDARSGHQLGLYIQYTYIVFLPE